MASCEFTHTGHRFVLAVTEQSYDAKTNTSVVKWTFSVTDNGTWYDSYAKCTVNGTVVYNRACGWDGGFPAKSGSTSGTLTVTHDSNGSKTIYFYLEGYAYYFDPQYANGSLGLANLDRNAPAVSVPSSSATSSSITFTINSDPAASQWAYQYKKTSDSSYSSWIYDNTAGSSRQLTISGLSTNVNYTVQVAAKKSTNDVWGYATFTKQTLGASPIDSAENIDLGQNCVIKWTPLNSDFSFKLQFSLGNWSSSVISIPASGTIIQQTYDDFQIPVDGPIQQMTSSTAQMTATLTTYNGSTQIGSPMTKSFTVTIPQTPATLPTISSVAIGEVPGTSNVSGLGVLVKGRSKLRATISASGQFTASITNYRVDIGSISISGTSSPLDTTGVITISGTYNAIITVTDSRGLSASTTQQVVIYDYFTPSGTISTTINGSIHLITNITWNIAPVDGNNTRTITIKRYSGSSASGTSTDESVATNSFSGTYEWDQTVSDNTQPYFYELIISDKVSTYTTSKGVTGSPIAISRLGGGGGVTFFGEALEKGLWLVEDGIYKEVTHGNANIFYGTCTNSASTVAKTVDCTKFTSENLKAGVVVLVKFSYSNTATSPTLNVNGTGAKPIYKYGTTVVGTNAAGSWTANAVTMLTYNGTGWIVNSGWDNNTTYTAMTQTEATTGTATTARSITAKVLHDTVVNLIYPVGSIYMSVNSTSPATLFGGTWVQLEDTFLLAAGSTYTAGTAGGEATHTLTTTEMPSHTHTFKKPVLVYHTSGDGTINGGSYNVWIGSDRAGTGQNQVNNTGSGGAHNNMPPYLAVYVWKRTE